METISPKRNRVYKRKFDHDLAREMAAKGYTAGEIRRHLGNTVSTTAIYRVINPKTNARLAAGVKKYLMGSKCTKCGANRTRLNHPRGTGPRDYPDSGLCRKCWSESKQTRYRVDDEENVIEVRCSGCKNWYPAEIFPKSRVGTRGFHNFCKSCSTKARAKYREKKKVPCAVCGSALVLPPEEKGERGSAIPRCRSCFDDLRTGRRDPIEGEAYIVRL